MTSGPMPPHTEDDNGSYTADAKLGDIRVALWKTHIPQRDVREIMEMVEEYGDERAEWERGSRG